MKTSPTPVSARNEPVDLAGLDELIGFQMRQTQGELVQRFLEVLAPLDLTQRQVGTLWLIAANPGIAQIMLGGALRMDRATTMGMIDRLEARSLVERRRSQSDRRRQELYLTPAGEALLKKTRVLALKREADLDARFSPDERVQLMDFLQRLQDRPTSA